MIKIIERSNGSVVFVGFYSKELTADEVEAFRNSIKTLCVDSFKDRAIAVPEGTEIDVLSLSEKD